MAAEEIGDNTDKENQSCNSGRIIPRFQREQVRFRADRYVADRYVADCSEADYLAASLSVANRARISASFF
jgi:hypothetical protein